MPQTISAAQVKTIILACEAGMGSSLMSVNSLKKKLKAAQVTDVTVVHKPARECPMAEPHPRASCGIVKAREQSQTSMDEAHRTHHDRTRPSVN